MMRSGVIERSSPIHPRLALAGDAHDEIVAGHVREATEVDAIGEFSAAGGEALIAAGGNAERVADRDGARRAPPQVDLRPTAPDAMRLDLNGNPGLGPPRPAEASACKKAVREAGEGVRREAE